MSYIHDALKKAQKERDQQDDTVSGIVTHRAETRPSPLGPRIKWVAGSLLVILLAFGLYSWLDFKADEPPAHEPFVSQVPRVPDPSTPEPSGVDRAARLYERARSFHKGGRSEDARRMYQATLSVDPGHVPALNNLGVLLLAEKDYEAARHHLEKAVRLGPDNVDPHYNLACVYALQGDVNNGLKYLNKAASIEAAVRDWARKDTDLKVLWGAPEFEELVGSPPE